MSNPEAFNVVPEVVAAPEAPLLRHDLEAFTSLASLFPEEVEALGHGSPLERPSQESQKAPAGQVLHVDDEWAREANRTSANDYLLALAVVGGDLGYKSFTAVQRRRIPNNVLSQRSFGEGSALVRRITENPEDYKLLRSLNMYSDLGKTKPVLEWADTVDELRGSRDHDHIVTVLLSPEHAEARRRLMPSFDRLDEEQQISMRNMIGCGFHLPQLNNGQALPQSLEQFYGLSQKEKRILLAQEIFDIGGAQGDTVTDGTMTLNESMYRRLRGQVAILLSEGNADLPPAERARKDYEQILAFHRQELGLTFDAEQPDKERAFTRFAIMFRDVASEQLQQIPRIFDEKLNAVTQEHLLDFLNDTGYEAEGRGAIMSMYSSTLAAKILRDATKAGFGFDQAMAASMQLVARLNAAVRKDIDITDVAVSHIVARDLMEAAEKDWTVLLTHDIVAEKTAPGEGYFMLHKQPTIIREPGDDRITDVESPADLLIPNENGLWVAGGGGGDVYTLRYLLRDVFEQQDATVVSVWGEADNMRDARPLGDTNRIFEATPHTKILGQRSMEHFVAADGLRTILLCLERNTDGTNNVEEDLLRIADMIDQPPSHIALVDTGGDITERSTIGSRRPGRDHISLFAARSLLLRLDTTIGNVLIATPGVDAPDDMNVVAHTAGMRILDLAPYGQQYVDRVDRDGLMTDDPNHYSRMIQALYYSLERRRAHVVQPLLLPVSQALKATRARPSHIAVTKQMSQLHIYDLEALAAAISA